MGTHIYYFSGTGNSLFAARELAKRLGDAELIPIAKCIAEKDYIGKAEKIGFVFPVHALTIPIVVRRFIRSFQPGQATYFFAIATRAGSVFRGFERIESLLKQKGKTLDAGFILNMYNNEARHKNYVVPSEKEILSLEKTVLEKLDAARDIISAKGTKRDADTEYTVKTASNPFFAFFIEKTVLLLMDIADYFGGAQYFRHDESCTGCGLCAKVCPSGKIRMVNKKPVWHRKTLCYMCFACLNYCPEKAVQINSIPGVRSFTEENGRYTHPYATAKEIEAQKGK